MTLDRRHFLRTVATAAGSTAALTAFPPAIARALAIAANNRTGTLQDVEHIVCLMQENRSFDHYFGSMRRRARLRRSASRSPCRHRPAAGKTVWYQRNDAATGSNPKVLRAAAQRHDANFALIRTAEHAAPVSRRAARVGPRPPDELAAVQEQPVDGVLHAARTSRSSSRSPTRSRSATTTTARSPAAPTRTAASSSPAPTTATTIRAGRASSTARPWTTATTR